MSEWIRMAERKPPCSTDAIEYMVFDSINNKVHHDYYMIPACGGVPFWNHYGDHVTHWMPLPEPPKD